MYVIELIFWGGGRVVWGTSVEDETAVHPCVTCASAIHPRQTILKTLVSVTCELQLRPEKKKKTTHHDVHFSL